MLQFQYFFGSLFDKQNKIRQKENFLKSSFLMTFFDLTVLPFHLDSWYLPEQWRLVGCWLSEGIVT